MWFEVLPPAIIMAVCISIPQYASYFYNKAVFGNPYRRNLEHLWDRQHFTRDCRVSGAPWILKGLEAIPDGPE